MVRKRRSRPKTIRKFDGKRYVRYSSFRRKREAKKLARIFRNQDVPGTPAAYLVRIVKTHGMWAVYRRRR